MRRPRGAGFVTIAPLRYTTGRYLSTNGARDMVSNSKGNQAPITSYFEPSAVQQLKKLSETTRIPQAAYLREALDDLLKKYASTLRKGSK